MKTILKESVLNVRRKLRLITEIARIIKFVTFLMSRGDLIELSTIETVVVCIAITLLCYIGVFAYYFIKNLCSLLWQKFKQ